MTSNRGNLERIEAALKDARALLNIVGPDTTPGQIGKVTVSIELALRDLEHLKAKEWKDLTPDPRVGVAPFDA